jgi:hypothetical protein
MHDARPPPHPMITKPVGSTLQMQQYTNSSTIIIYNNDHASYGGGNNTIQTTIKKL